MISNQTLGVVFDDAPNFNTVKFPDQFTLLIATDINMLSDNYPKELKLLADIMALVREYLA